ncbi:DUF6228 family protein [Streptomyces sp. NPDC058268]|uniref:DUF6228 family protein n=1 Tax=Streptomyces sp. NPDC058268 TaxID=3346413 RepID=UPI0036E9722C
MTSSDGAIDDKPGVSVRFMDNAPVGVRLSATQPFDEGCVHYVVEAWAPGLTVRIDEGAAWFWEADLAAFLTELAADIQHFFAEESQ